MKKKLVRILALSLLVSSLGACGGNSSSEGKSDNPTSSTSKDDRLFITPSELYELEFDDDYNVSSPFEGKQVYIEDLRLMAYHGNTGYFYYEGGQMISDLKCVEADLDFLDFEDDYSKYNITVNGTVRYENGRVHLVDASYELIYPLSRAGGFYGLDDRFYNRKYWEEFSEYNMHGVLTYGDIQLGSIPTLDSDEDEIFYVTFPGEDYDVTNEDNVFPLPVTVPGDLTKESKDYLKSVFNGLEPGDGLNITAVVDYTEQGMGWKIVDGFADYIEETTLSIIKTWDKAVKSVQNIYSSPIVDLGIDEYALSYLIDSSYASNSLSDLFQNPDMFGFRADELDDIAFTDWSINIKTGKIEEAIEELHTKLEAAGFECAGSEEDSGETFEMWYLDNTSGGTTEEGEYYTDIAIELFYNFATLEMYYLDNRLNAKYDAIVEIAALFNKTEADIDSDYLEEYGCYCLSIDLGNVTAARSIEYYANQVKNKLPVTAVAAEVFRKQEVETPKDSYQFIARYVWSNGADVNIFVFQNGSKCYVEFDVYDPADFAMESAASLYYMFTGKEQVPPFNSEVGAYVFKLNFGTVAETGGAEELAGKIVNFIATQLDMQITSPLRYDEDYAGYIVVLSNSAKACSVQIVINEQDSQGEDCVICTFFVYESRY